MCDSTMTQPQLLAYATKMGLVGKGGNDYGGIKSPSKKKPDLCATINKALGAGVAKRTERTGRSRAATFKQEASEAVVLEKTNANDAKLYALEAAIRGPTPTMKTCVDSTCSETTHCSSSMFRNKCHLKGDYLTRFVQLMNVFYDTRVPGTTLLTTDANTKKNLTDVAVTDVLHDISKSNYFGLGAPALAEIDTYLKEVYVKQLALLYFVIIAHKKLKQGFDPDALKFIMVQDKPLIVMIKEAREHHVRMKADGSLSLSGKQKIAIAGATVAFGLAAYAGGSHYLGHEGTLSLKWYQEIVSRAMGTTRVNPTYNRAEDLRRELLEKMSVGSGNEQHRFNTAMESLSSADQEFVRETSTLIAGLRPDQSPAPGFTKPMRQFLEKPVSSNPLRDMQAINAQHEAESLARIAADERLARIAAENAGKWKIPDFLGGGTINSNKARPFVSAAGHTLAQPLYDIGNWAVDTKNWAVDTKNWLNQGIAGRVRGPQSGDSM